MSRRPPRPQNAMQLPGLALWWLIDRAVRLTVALVNVWR